MKERHISKTTAWWAKQMKYAFMVIIDLCIFAFSATAGIYVTCQGQLVGTAYAPIMFNYVHTLILAAALLLIFRLLGIHTSVWRFAGVDEMIRCTIAAVLLNAFWMLLDRVIYTDLLHIQAVLPFYTYMVSALFTILLLNASRLCIKFFRFIQARSPLTTHGKKRVMIVGAGFMGSFIIQELRHNMLALGVPVVAVDDDPEKIGRKINAVKIKGSCADIVQLAESERIDTIILCIPSASKKRQKEIIETAMQTNCTIKISPSISEFLEDTRAQRRIRNVDISDLLPRPEVTLDKEVCAYLTGKVILVTGGGGSIGSELCRQAARYAPKQIVIFDIYENCAFELYGELKQMYGENIDLRVQIGSVRDEKRLDEVFGMFKPDVVFHAAAHKHVPLMETSPCEAIKNNVMGTYNTAAACDKHHVSKFVLLSTDKAVNPTNVMGASKRLCEFTAEYFNSISQTCYTIVRFGNVLGSHGSVVPIFRKQIEEGGPVCVTDENITRYFMTIPEAAQLVCQAGGLAKGGEIFVLDMGEPVKIMDLAKNMIRLSGFTEDEIEIRVTGLRPGEKLYEELATEEERKRRKKTANNKIWRLDSEAADNAKMQRMLSEIPSLTNNTVRAFLKENVPGYMPQKAVHL